MPKIKRVTTQGITSNEHQEQVAVFDWIRVKELSDVRYAGIIAVPNQGKRSAGARNYFYREGMHSGIPDILCLVPNSEYNGLAIEMKVGSNKCTPAQLSMQSVLRSLGWSTVVCYSADEAIKCIESYFLEKPQSD